ncbi:MAG TPA: chemotaxis protein CheW [Longimicrobiaceae bacterium]
MRPSEAAARPAAGGAGGSPEGDRRVLEERARLLARPEAPGPDGFELELVTFSLAGERFAIDAQYLLAVARVERVTTVPGTDPTVYGVMAWRGELLLIRDYRSLLGLAADPERAPGCVLVAGEDRPAFGILADEAGEFVKIPASQVHPAPGRDDVGLNIVRGVTGGMLMVLDAVELWNLHG